MENKIRITDESGTRVAELVTIVYNEDVTKKYAVYTFNPEAENVDLYAAVINDSDGKISFDPIATKEEWELVKKEIINLSKGI